MERWRGEVEDEGGWEVKRSTPVFNIKRVGWGLAGPRKKDGWAFGCVGF